MFATPKISSHIFGFGNSTACPALPVETGKLRSLCKHATVIGISLLWIVTTIFAYWHFMSYESVPGGQAKHPQQFPLNSSLSPSSSGDTLLMFIHPKCPCTSASLNELAVLSTRCRGKLNAIAVFIRPDQTPEGWEHTDYWQRAARIPGVKAVSDPHGQEAKIFGALTSGEVLLYDGNGKLVFSGGITGGRGHEGDNQGLDSVTGIIGQNDRRCKTTNTYGCALNGPSEEAAIAQGLRK